MSNSCRRVNTVAVPPGCFSKDQVYLDGILRILRHRQTINFPLLTALGKVSQGHRPGAASPGSARLGFRLLWRCGCRRVLHAVTGGQQCGSVTETRETATFVGGQ